MTREGQRRKGRGARATKLDARALGAVACFVRVLARAGCAPQDIGREVQKACRTVPMAWRRHSRAELTAIDAAAHVLTLWHSDPEYLDARGKPRALPLREKGSCIKALLRRVNPELRLSNVLSHLLQTRTLRRVGKRSYLPNDRVLSFRGTQEPYHSRLLRALLAMLRTLEHNSIPDRNAPPWCEMLASNARFPVSARAAFDDRLRRLARQFLFHLDADMHRHERARRKGERTVPLGVGVYLFEEAPLRRARAARKRPRGAPR